MLKNWSRRTGHGPEDPLLGKVHVLRTLDGLREALGWSRRGSADERHHRVYRFLEDLNDRPWLDAQLLATAAANCDHALIVEIGTGEGRGTCLLAANAPGSTIVTVNAPPEQVDGVHVTAAYSREQIGKLHREAGFSNVEQVLVDSRRWEPDLPRPIDLGFVDGCHDREVVRQDVRTLVRRCRDGAVLLLHDFNPDKRFHFAWLDEVYRAIGDCVRQGWMSGPIFHLQDSWMGVYRVGEQDIAAARRG